MGDTSTRTAHRPRTAPSPSHPTLFAPSDFGLRPPPDHVFARRLDQIFLSFFRLNVPRSNPRATAALNDMFGSIGGDDIGTDDIEMSFTSLTPLVNNGESSSSSSSAAERSSSFSSSFYSDSDASRVQKLVDTLSSVPKDTFSNAGASIFRSMGKESAYHEEAKDLGEGLNRESAEWNVAYAT